MKRKEIETIEDALTELPEHRRLQPILAGSPCLPFSHLDCDDFELFCFLLLKKERDKSSKRVYYYGKTADRGRDIIVENFNGSQELISAKNFCGNVGLHIIRDELAKLAMNSFLGRIDRPSKLAFYISNDLTSPAIDLIRKREIWQNCCEQAIREYLGRTPTKEEIAYAKDFWPDPDYQSGIELTERSLKHPEVVEHFFNVQKVTSGTPDDNAKAVVQLLQKEGYFPLRPNTKPPISDIQNILNKLGEDNPGLSVSVEVTKTGYLFRIVASGGRTVPIGTLLFPKTTAGAIGENKIKRALAEGTTVCLEEGEFYWKSEIKGLGQLSTSEGMQKQLTIIPNIPKTRIPVIIKSSNKENGELKELRCFMQLVRLGTEELETEISGGEFGGVLIFKAKKYPGPCSAHLSLNLQDVSLTRAKVTLEFVQLLENESDIEIRDFEKELTLIRAKGVKLVPIKGLSNSIELINQAISIEQEFCISLRYPDKVEDNDARQIILVASGIEYGLVSEPPPQGPITIHANKRSAKDILYVAATSPGTLSVENRLPYSIFGTKLPDIDEIHHYEGITFHEDLTALKERFDKLDEQDEIDIEISCNRLVHEYPGWKREEKGEEMGSKP